MLLGTLRERMVLLVQLDLFDHVLIARADAVLAPALERCDAVFGLLGEADVADQRVTLSNVERDVRKRQLVGVESFHVLGL